MPRKKGDGSFKKLPNGTVELTVNAGFDLYGKRKRKKFYGKTEAECRKQYKEWLKSGGEQSAEIQQGLTLSAWLDIWLSSYKKDNVTESTYEDYVNLATHIKDHKIGKLNLTDVKPIHVTELFASKFSYSQSFRKRMRFLLTSSFECAIDNDLCTKNPVRSAAIAKKAETEKEPFTEEEAKAILEFAKTDKLFGTAVYIMLNTGIRSGEMRALKPGKINFDKNVVLIDTAVKRHGVLGLPKNNKPRIIPLKPGVAEFIKANIDMDAEFIVGGSQFTTRSGFRSRYLCFLNRLNKSLEDNGQQPIESKSPHSLRHTFCTQLQKNGMPIALVSELMGHHSTEVTDKYTHLGDVDTLSKAVQDYDLFSGNEEGGDSSE